MSKDSSDNGEKIEELKVALEIAKRELTHAEDEVADLRMVCIKGDSETANFKEKIKSLEQDNIKLERQLQEQLELTRRSKSVKNRSRKNFIPDSDSDDLDSDEDRSVGATTFSRQMNNPHAFRSPTSKKQNQEQPTSPVDSVMKSIPEQVALRLRRAAALNQELQGRMFAAEEEVSRLRKLEDDRFEAFEEENKFLKDKVEKLKDEVLMQQNSMIAANADY